jgi:PAS domain S-box-containing protein
VHDLRASDRVGPVSGVLTSLLLLIGVLAVDLYVPLGFAAPMLYLPVVLVAFRYAGSLTVAAVAGVAALLTVLGLWLSPPAAPGLPESYIVANRLVTVIALLVCGWVATLAVRNREQLEATNRLLREAQDSVERQTRMLQIAGEVGQFGGWTVDVRNNTVQWSAEVARIHGMSPESMHSVETGVSFYVPEDQPRIAEAFARCVRDGTPFNEELQLVRQSDGALRWVNAIGRAERDEDGQVTFVHGALQDVTDRIEAQIEAQRTRQTFDALGEAMPFIIWTAGPDGDIDYASDELWRYAGVLTQDVAGDGWLALVHPEDRAATLETWHAALASGEDLSLTYRFRRRDGRHRWHLVRAVPERDVDGSVVRWWGSNTDIDDVHTLEQQSLELARRLNATLESIGDAVLSLDTEWRVTFVNSHGERLLQHSREQLMGRNIWMVFPEAIDSVFQHEYERAVAERRPATFGAPFEPLDIYAEVSAYPHDEGLTIYFRDVSERRALGSDGQPVHESVETGNTESTD